MGDYTGSKGLQYRTEEDIIFLRPCRDVNTKICIQSSRPFDTSLSWRAFDVVNFDERSSRGGSVLLKKKKRKKSTRIVLEIAVKDRRSSLTQIFSLKVLKSIPSVIRSFCLERCCFLSCGLFFIWNTVQHLFATEIFSGNR